MECLFPITVRKGEPNECVVPCGKCYSCRSNMRNDWSIRLKVELENSFGGLFLTLTYDDLHLRFSEYVDVSTGVVIQKPWSDPRDIQLFMKRLRKKFGTKSFRYFAVSEYGEQTLRPHWHMLLFFQFDVSFDKFLYDSITDLWSCGFVHFGNIEDASIHYVTKYVLKFSDVPLGIFDTKVLCSKRPAIGSHVLDLALKNNLPNRDFSSFSHHGSISRLPRLYRDKLKSLLSDDEKEELSSAYILEKGARLLKEFSNSKYTNFNDFISYKRASFLHHSDIVSSHLSKHNKL